MYQWENLILDTFFDHDSLGCIIPYFCQCMTEKKEKMKMDPISSVMIVFLNTPIHLIVHETGVSLFSGKSTMIYPYYNMSEKQKQCIIELCQQPSEYNILNQTIVFKRTPNHSILAPIDTALQVMCSKILASKYITDKKTQIAVCNIIMQRLQGYIPISSVVQKNLNEWLKQFVV
jgi:hypothetical protein